MSTMVVLVVGWSGMSTMVVLVVGCGGVEWHEYDGGSSGGVA